MSVGSDEGSTMEDSKEEEEGRFTGGETFVSGGGVHTQEGGRQVRRFPLKTNMEEVKGQKISCCSKRTLTWFGAEI